MLTRLLWTRPDYLSLVLRLVLGLVIFPHGARKLLGWFGGYGFEGSMAYFTETLGIPWILGLLAIAAEFFGGIALVLGLLTRVAALGVGTVMVVAALTVFGQTGTYFMNWTGQQAGEGIEFHLLAIALAVAVIVRGGGAYSVDRLVSGEPADMRRGEAPFSKPATAA